jgi:undecaprenyl-diphosphatase
LDKTSTRFSAPVALVLVLLATLLGTWTAGDNVTTLDVTVLEWIQHWQGNIPAALQHTGDMLGDTLVAIAAVLVGVAIAALLRARRIVAFLVFVGFLRVIGTGLKPIFASPRPITPEVRQRIYETTEGLGYPSGHSMTAAMIATMAVIIVWHATTDAFIRSAVLVLALLYAGLVGWSRIWVGAHWPTDVLGGWSYGVALVLLAWVLTRPLADSGTQQGPPQSQQAQERAQ